MTEAQIRFPEGGQMGARVRELDWSQTALGPIEQWPQSLVTAVRIILDSRYPMFVWWGDELINIYNDSYIDVLGQRHPSALGRPAQETWGDIWDAIGPLVDTVIKDNQATFNNELELFMERNGYLEETFFTFSYSPLRDPDSGVRGLFCACIEDTERVINERRRQLLRTLGDSTHVLHSVDDALDGIADSLRAFARDVSFAMVYEEQDGMLVLQRAVGVDDQTDIAAPTVAITGDEPVPTGGIPPSILREVFAGGTAREVDAAAVDVAMPGGEWSEPASRASLLPLSRGGERYGLLVLGASPRLQFDAAYRDFFELVANAVSSLITRADAYENQRKRADALAELDRAKTVFFGNVSHEFRTPLTLMMAPIEEMAAEPSLDRQQREQLELARRNGQRLIKLVNTLLDFSRIEAGRIEARYQPTDLAEVTAELASMFRSAVETAGLEYHVNCEPIDESVFVDRDMWEKIVMNLLSNALKYTMQGSIRVDLSRTDDRVELAVSDTGIGIPAGEASRVFERFHRVEGAHGRTQEGTGIGLSLVSELVKLHGGDVTVESVQGEGSTFRVSIPLGSEHLPADRIEQMPQQESSRIGVAAYIEEALRWLPADLQRIDHDEAATQLLASAQSPTVLIADDNADMRSYLRRLLSPHYRIIVVGDGERALKETREQLPDLVLSDVMMPGLDGFGLLQKLRTNPATSSVPVVLLSARAGEEARAEGLEAGADDYIVKPFHARELLARVSAQIELARVRRGAEVRITNLLEGSTSGFLMIDAEGRYQYVNPAAEQLLGRSSEEMIGRKPDEVFPESQGDTSLDLLYEVLETRESKETEVFFEPWDRWFKTKIDPSLDDGVTVQFDEVTQMRKAIDAMHEVDRRKDEFLATLAHELRNPLAPIRNGLQLLLKSPDEKDPRQLYEMMDRQAEHLTRLVNDLMEVSRINRGKVELRLEPISLSDALQSSIESIGPELQQRQQLLDVTLAREPVYVDGDMVRLAQVFSNLLGNASKFSPSGGRIGVRVTAASDEVQIDIIDEGIGLTTDQIKSIFDPFQQVETAPSQRSGGLGLGLGLTVVRELIFRHGGEVRAHSDGPGKGSCFTVILPLTEAPLQVQARAETAAPERSDKKRVLIVDDNRDAADSLAELLGRSGIEVKVAYDGNSAVDAFAAYRPGAVILDIGLPDIDGYEVARRIRQSETSTACLLIALTGWGQDGDRAESAAAGFDRHFVKPADWRELLELI